MQVIIRVKHHYVGFKLFALHLNFLTVMTMGRFLHFHFQRARGFIIVFLRLHHLSKL